MHTRNRAVLAVVCAITSFAWIIRTNAQDAPAVESSGPPVPISFSDNALPDIGELPPSSASEDPIPKQLEVPPSVPANGDPNSVEHDGASAIPSDDRQSILGSARPPAVEMPNDSSSISGEISPMPPTSRYQIGNAPDRKLSPVLPPDRASSNESAISVRGSLEPMPGTTAPWSAETDANAHSTITSAGIFVGQQIQPATHFEFESGQPNSMAAQVLQVFSIDQWTGSLPCQPISLTDWIAQAPIDNRPEMVRSYWRAFEKWAIQVSARTEINQLAEIRIPGGAIERDMLTSAQSLAKARVLESEVELADAQQWLTRFSPMPHSDLRPLPKDLPLVDEYVTNYEYFGRSLGLNPRLNQIHQSLPKTLEIIQARAEATNKCRVVVQQAIQACNQNQLAVGSALEAIRMCRESQNEFIRSVLRYNQDIAEYAMSVAPVGQPADQMVSMLIKQPGVLALAESPNVGVSTLPSRYTTPQSVLPSSESIYQPNMVRTANLESTLPRKEVTELSPLTGPSTRPGFGAAGSQPDASGWPNASTVNGIKATPPSFPNAVPPVQNVQPSAIQFQLPSSPSSGGGSFSFGSR